MSGVPANPSTFPRQQRGLGFGFSADAGQARFTVNDPRSSIDDFTMPDFCFLDDADPDWDVPVSRVTTPSTLSSTSTFTWEMNDVWYADFDRRESLISKAPESATRSVRGRSSAPTDVESDVVYQELQFKPRIRGWTARARHRCERTSEEDSELVRFEPAAARHERVQYVKLANGNTSSVSAWARTGLLGPATTYSSRMRRPTEYSRTPRFTSANRVNLTLGARRSLDEKEFSSTQFASDNFSPQFGTSTTISAADEWSATDWRVTLDYQITDDSCST